MNFYTDDKPIIACSTGTTSNTAIAVIRLSGFKNLLDLAPYFSFDLIKVHPRKSHLTNIIFQNKIFDNALLVFFPEGHSYTGENVLELSIHGNQLNIYNILQLFVENAYFRPANPGEFTFRALKNKKLSLSQVEGLDLLLNANSNLMLSQGLDILQGDLYRQYLALHEAFLKLKAAIEISIDFSDDVGTEESQSLFHKSFDFFFKIISSLKARSEGNVSTLLSPEIVLVGQTNAGKSSLFNILLKHDRSIVSNIPGTTRDYVSEVINISGNNFKLLDTAGIRDSNDVIENIGIERAMSLLNRSFFKVLIINPFESDSVYFEKFNNVIFDFLLISHCDQKNFIEKISSLNLSKIHTYFLGKCSLVGESGSIEPLQIPGPMGPIILKNGPIEPLANSGSIEPATIKTGPIEPILKNLVNEKYVNLTSNNPILLERHRFEINKIYLSCLQLSKNLNNINDIAIISSEVNLLGHSLNELVGIVSPDDVLNSIFSNFCIGK